MIRELKIELVDLGHKNIVGSVPGQHYLSYIDGFLSIENESEIVELYVATPFRGVRNGYMLLTQFEQQAKHHGSTKIKVWSTPEAASFYQRHGYTIVPDQNDSKILMRKELE